MKLPFHHKLRTLAFLLVTAAGAVAAAASFAGCGSSQPARGDVAATPAAPEQRVAAISPEELARQTALVDRLIGGWAGSGTGPFGEMSFAVVFEREADGAARAWADDGKGTKIDLRVHRGERGWSLSESATLPGVGTQAHTLVAATSASSTDGDRLIFRHPERPGYLDLELSLTPGQLRLVATVRGTPHVDFSMRRLPDEAVPALRSRLHAPGTSVSAVPEGIARGGR